MLYLPDYYNIVNLVGAQAKDKGMTAVMMGGDGWDSADLDVKAADGGFYSNHYDPGDTRPIVLDWLKKYGAEYKDASGNPKVPDALATLAYDATNLLFAAIEKAGADDTTKVAEALAGIVLGRRLRQDHLRCPAQPDQGCCGDRRYRWQRRPLLESIAP